MTLIELVMSMAISAILVALAAQGYQALMDIFGISRQLTTCQLAQSEAYMALERDLKSAGADPLGAHLFSGATMAVEIVPPGQAEEGGLRLRRDITGAGGQPDGDLGDEDEVVTYALDPNDRILYRWSATGAGGMIAAPVVSAVTTFTPELLDSAGAPLDAAGATQVRITLVRSISLTDSRPSAPGSQQIFTIALRNRLL
jgi:type II secretory pathway component PulJ